VNLVRLAAPTTLIVTAAQAATHVRSVNAAELTELEEWSKAAQRLVETRIDRALTEQGWRLSLDAFPAIIKLPRSPLITVSALTYVDTNGVTQTLAVSAYRIDSDAEPATIEPAYGTSWPSTAAVKGAVKVSYTSGHATGRPAPEQAAPAIKLYIGHWYENREAVITGTISTELDQALDALLASCRIIAEYDQ
jgi:uncharacterized phiE125 gp8 family phage protein